MKPLISSTWLLPLLLLICCRISAGDNNDRNEVDPILPDVFELYYSVTSKESDVFVVAEVSEFINHNDRSSIFDHPSIGHFQIITRNNTNFILGDHECTIQNNGNFDPKNFPIPDAVTFLKKISKSDYKVTTNSSLGVDVVVFIKETLVENSYNFSGRLEVHWSEYGWSWPNCVKNCDKQSVPLSMRISGKINGSNFERNYTFWKYYDYIRDETVFQIPDGYYCPVNTPNKLNMGLDKSYVLSVEVIAQDSKTDIKVWSNVTNQTNLERMDTRSLTIPKDGKTQNEKQIIDRKHQISYLLDEDVGKCEIKKFNETDPVINAHILDLLFGIKNTDTFVYNGKKPCRTGICDNWATQMMDEIITINLRTEQYVGIDFNIPVSITVRGVREQKTLGNTYFNVFNYYPNEQHSNHEFAIFDTSDCFDDSKILEFQLSVVGKIPNDLNSLKFDIVRSILIQIPNVNPIRFSDIQLFQRDGALLIVTVVLLEDVENSGLISKSKGFWISNSPSNLQIYHILEASVDQNAFFISPSSGDLLLEVRHITKDVVRPEQLPLPVVPKTFQAHKRSIMIEEDELPIVLEIDEYFSESLAIESIILHRYPKTVQMILQKDPLSFITIADSKDCTVVIEGDFPKLPALDARLALGLVKSEHFVERTKYNGIPGLKFEARNVSIQDYGKNINIEVIWSEYGWKWSYCGKENDCLRWSSPLLIHVYGIKNGPYNYRYEFTEFFDEIQNTEGFQIPDGVYCQNFSTSYQEKPLLNNSYSMKLEKHFVDGNTSYAAVKVLKISQSTSLLRFDNRSLLHDDEVTDYDRVIIDDKHGYGFKIDVDSGKCNLILENAINLFFENPDSIQYIGSKKCREGLCDVWVGQQSDGNIVDGYYAKKQFNTLGGSVESVVPVVFTEYVSNDFITKPVPIYSLHTFDFRPEYPDWSHFDVRDCYNETDILKFQLTVEGSYAVISNKLHPFEAAVRYAIRSRLTPISDLRLTGIKVSNVGDKYIIVYVTLLEDIVNAGLKSENSGNEKIPTNIDIYDTLVMAIFKKELKIVFTENYDPNSKTFEFFVVGITNDVISEEKTNEASVILRQFVRNDGVDVKIPFIEFSGTSTEECAEACTNEKSIRCESFVYCKGICKMLATHYQFIPKDQVISASNCAVFARNFTMDYKMYEGDRIISESSDKTVVEEMEKCSYLCSDPKSAVTEKPCMGYDICLVKGEVNKKKCTFHSKHIMEIPHSQLLNDAECIHMSKKDILDFDLLPNSTYLGSDYDRVQQESTPDGCAHTCILRGSDCRGFEACSSESNYIERQFCYLLIPKDTSNVKDMSPITQSTICDHYYRLSTGIKSKTRQAEAELKYSKGSFVGLLIAMLILGLLFGAIIALFLNRSLIPEQNCFTRTHVADTEDQYNMNLIESLPSTSKTENE